MADEEQNKLYLEDIYKSYDGKVVLDDVDLAVSKGELCTLVGPSGCGKSTLLRLILGDETQDSGVIKVDGAPVGPPDPHRGIVYQKYSLFPNRTVIDNVMLGKVYSEGQWWNPLANTRAFREEAMEYLTRVRLADAADKYPHELSGGMQQRVAIAQALIMKPPVLLMDEPFGALDPDTRDELQVFLLELWEEQNLTIFFVTHDLVEACFLGSRLLVLSQYYTDGRGEGEHVKRGGKIIADHHLSRAVSSTEVKDSPEFQSLIRSVRSEGFDPNIRQHVNQFNLRHPDSFRTLTAQEKSM